MRPGDRPGRGRAFNPDAWRTSGVRESRPHLVLVLGLGLVLLGVRWPGWPGAGTGLRPWVLVLLPFPTWTPADQYFADGLTKELTANTCYAWSAPVGDTHNRHFFARGWASGTHPLPIGTKSLNLGALMGFSVGESNTTSNQIPLFGKEGITHFDFSAGLPLTVGTLSITPNAHFQINVDDATKFTSGTQADGKTVFTIGTTLSWSRAFGAPPEEAAGEPAQ